jgi:aldehyde dehydrogenase (NAD+)
MATTLEPVALPKVRHTECFIDGKWVPAASGKTFATMNPATEEEIAQVAEGDAADIDRAVKAARKAFENSTWSRMDARDRGRLIYRLADLIEEEIDELAALESLDNGKPVRDARAADLPLVVRPSQCEAIILLTLAKSLWELWGKLSLGTFRC